MSKAAVTKPQRIVDLYDGLLCDLDGVVYAGQGALQDAVESLNRAMAQGLRVGFVTNNASRRTEAVADHLRGLGLQVGPAHVFGSAAAAARLARDNAAGWEGLNAPHAGRLTAMVVGSDALREQVTGAGFTVMAVSEDANPDYVIQGFDPGLAWADLAAAAYAIQRGARWVASNTDSTIPRAPGIAPGNGSLVAAVRRAVDVDPLVAGKPQPTLMLLAAQELRCARPLMIGDRLDTDIAGGIAAGMDTALVLTGIDSRDSAERAGPRERPTYIINTLADLFAPAAPARL